MNTLEFKIGDMLKDNDKRCAYRRLTIIALGVRGTHGIERVQAKTNIGRAVWIDTRRIHTDGKPRKSGFDLIRVAA